jgi:Fe-S cluster biogenesis protein NfuA
MSQAYNSEERYRTQVVTLYTEANPNPNSMKFMLNFLLLSDGNSIDFASAEEASRSPLAQELFQFPFVQRVFYMSNFITLTKSDEVEWMEVIPQLKQFIKGYFEQERPLFTEEQPEVIVELNNDSEAVKKIKGVLDEYVRPAVEMDGGAIRFDSFDEGTGVLRVQLQGSCSGCPSSTVTLKQGIQNLMRQMVPSVKEVVAEGV